jgi:hypothetical protein
MAAALRIDTDDSRVGVRAADDGQVDRAVEPKVADVTPASGQEAVILPPPEGLTDQLRHALNPSLARRASQGFGGGQ